MKNHNDIDETMQTFTASQLSIALKLEHITNGVKVIALAQKTYADEIAKAASKYSKTLELLLKELQS